MNLFIVGFKATEAALERGGGGGGGGGGTPPCVFIEGGSAGWFSCGVVDGSLFNGFSASISFLFFVFFIFFMYLA